MFPVPPPPGPFPRRLPFCFQNDSRPKLMLAKAENYQREESPRLRLQVRPGECLFWREEEGDNRSEVAGLLSTDPTGIKHEPFLNRIPGLPTRLRLIFSSRCLCWLGFMLPHGVPTWLSTVTLLTTFNKLAARVPLSDMYPVSNARKQFRIDANHARYISETHTKTTLWVYTGELFTYPKNNRSCDGTRNYVFVSSVGIKFAPLRID